MSPVRRVGKGLCSGEQQIERARRKRFAVWLEESTEPDQVCAGPLEKYDLHPAHFRGADSGGGSSLGCPQLLTHACMDDSEIASLVRS